MSGPLRSEDNDPRPEQMTADPGRYYGDAWERSKREVLADRDAEAPESRPASSNPAMLVPGIVRMSLRGNPADVEQVLAILEAAKVKVWRGDSPGTKGGNRAGYSYFTIEVPGDRDG